MLALHAARLMFLLPKAWAGPFSHHAVAGKPEESCGLVCLQVCPQSSSPPPCQGSSLRMQPAFAQRSPWQQQHQWHCMLRRRLARRLLRRQQQLTASLMSKVLPAATLLTQVSGDA